MIQQVRRVIKNIFDLYKDDIGVILFAVALLKFSRRWQDSFLGYIFFPLMLIVMFRMSLEHKLFAMLFLIPFAESRQIPGQIFGIVGFNPINILFLMIAVPVIFRERNFLPKSAFRTWIIIFILMNFISALRGVGSIPYFGGYYTLTYYFLNTFLKPMEILMCGIMAYYVLSTPDQAVRFLRMIKLSGVVLGGYVLLRSGHTIETLTEVVKTLSIHKNALSFIFLTLLTMNLATMNFGDEVERNMSRLFNLVYISCIMFTFSRQGYVSCVVVMFLYAMRKGFKWIVVLIAGLMIFWTFFIPFSVKQRIYTGTEEGAKMGVSEHLTGDVTAGREKTWEACIPAMMDNFLIGQGRFAYVKLVYSKNEDFPIHPHNAYIQSMLDNGILGSIFFVGFYFALIKKSWVIFKKSESKFASFYALGFVVTVVIFLLQGFTGFRFYPYEENYFVWFYLGGLLWIEHNQKYLVEHGM